VTGEVKPSTSAEIPIDEFPDDESKYIKVGGTFRWSIGYRRSRSGQKDRISRIIFRKMPLYLQNDMDAVKKEARGLVEFFEMGIGRNTDGARSR